MKNILTSILLSISIYVFAQGDKQTKPENFLNTLTKFNFDKEEYIFKWSNAQEAYFKQEYFRAKEPIDNANRIFTIELLNADVSVELASQSKVQEMEERKKIDPIANYQVFENKDNQEVIVDFLISDKNIYEWNVYRYKNITTNKGKSLLLISYNIKAFKGSEISKDDFFDYIKKNRLSYINQMTKFPIPAINQK